MIGIYKITSPSNRIYVGQSVRIERRKTEHKKLYGIGPKLKHSYEKYGFENHIFEIIEECSVEQLEEREIYWKKYYVDLVGWDFVLFHNLYDLGSFGPWREEQKEEHRKRYINRKITWNVGRKVGYIVSEEEKEKRRIPKSEETKIKMRKPRSEEAKLNMRKPKTNTNNMKYPRKELTCPHCNKIGKGNIMYRYHFNKCNKL